MMRFFSSSFALWGLVLLQFSGLGCTGGAGGTFMQIAAAKPQAAQRSVTLRVLQYDGYVVPSALGRYFRHMRDQHGLNVSLSINNISSERELFRAARLGSAHLITPGVDIIADPQFDFAKRKLARPLDPAVVTNMKQIEFVAEDDRLLAPNGSGRAGVPFAQGAYFIFVNEKTVPQPVMSLRELFQPDPGRTVTMPRYPAHRAYLAAMAGGLEWTHFADYDRLFGSRDFLDVYRKQAAAVTVDAGLTDDPDEYLASDYLIGFGFGFRGALEKGGRFRAMVPKEGLLLWRDYLVLTNEVNRSLDTELAAQELLNELISREYQSEVVLKKLGSAPVRSDAFSSLGRHEREHADHLHEVLKSGVPHVLLPGLDERSRNGFELLDEKYPLARSTLGGPEEHSSPRSRGL